MVFKQTLLHYKVQLVADQLSNTIVYGIQTNASALQGYSNITQLGTTSNVQFFSVGVGTAHQQIQVKFVQQVQLHQDILMIT
jgi:hypothetical protein